MGGQRQNITQFIIVNRALGLYIYAYVHDAKHIT